MVAKRIISLPIFFSNFLIEPIGHRSLLNQYKMGPPQGWTAEGVQVPFPPSDQWPSVTTIVLVLSKLLQNNEENNIKKITFCFYLVCTITMSFTCSCVDELGTSPASPLCGCSILCPCVKDQV